MSKIASLARVINRNSIQSIDELSSSSDDHDLLEALIISNEHLAAQVGFLADLCASKIKFFETKGGAEKWLLPPAYHCQSEPIHPA
jgi:hypothetical protein